MMFNCKDGYTEDGIKQSTGILFWKYRYCNANELKKYISYMSNFFIIF